MRMRASLLSILQLAIVAAAITATAAEAATAYGAATEPRPEQFTGSLVNMIAGARSSQPFILSIDRYASDAEVQRFTNTLTAKGSFSLRDELWRQSAGYLSIGGRIGYPIAAVIAQETPAGRTIHVVMNRPLSTFEVQYYTRSSKYPFSVIELNLDRNGKGKGRFIAAAKLQMDGDTLNIESLGVQPLRLLAVQAD